MSYVFDTFWFRVLDLVISTYFLSNILMGQCLIYINLCTFHEKKNSTRLQWYSCARYKAPGPLVLIKGLNFGVAGWIHVCLSNNTPRTLILLDQLHINIETLRQSLGFCVVVPLVFDEPCEFSVLKFSIRQPIQSKYEFIEMLPLGLFVYEIMHTRYFAMHCAIPFWLSIKQKSDTRLLITCYILCMNN